MKIRKATLIQKTKESLPSWAHRVIFLGLLILMLLVLFFMITLVLGDDPSSLPGAPPEIIGTIDNDNPFETFRASRMALEETIPTIDPVTEKDDHAIGPVPPQRLFRKEQADLNDDGEKETYSLRNGRLTVTDLEARLLWHSPKEWWIDDFFLGDITNDGQQNLCLSLWKEGSYGPYKPFWVETNDSLVRNHLFLYQMETVGPQSQEKPSLKALWQSSHLARPNYTVFMTQIDGDGINHLAVIQGDYEYPLMAEIAYWKWNGWGFSPSHN